MRWPALDLKGHRHNVGEDGNKEIFKYSDEWWSIGNTNKKDGTQTYIITISHKIFATHTHTQIATNRNISNSENHWTSSLKDYPQKCLHKTDINHIIIISQISYFFHFSRD